MAKHNTMNTASRAQVTSNRASAARLIAQNRTARHEYDIDTTWEAGIELVGCEVKSLRERACQITDTFCIVRKRELFLVGLHIPPYSHGGIWNIDADRRRKLLMHRKQITTIERKLQVKGIALVPLKIYFDEHSRVKVQVGLGRGKKLYDKRASAAKRDSDREIARALKERAQQR